MICQNCGQKLDNNTSFCTRCGNKINFKNNETPNKNETLLKVLIGVVTLFSICLVVFMLIFMTKKPDASYDLSLDVESVPLTTQDSSIIICGSATTGPYDSWIEINGDRVVEISKNAHNSYWEYEVNLHEGDNEFDITLHDGKDETTKNVDVYCEPINARLPFPKGTLLVKDDEEGIFIRPTPCISEEYLMLIPYNDYSVLLEFMGKIETDAEGYDWYSVKTPSNGTGWVRSDLVRVY